VQNSRAPLSDAELADVTRNLVAAQDYGLARKLLSVARPKLYATSGLFDGQMSGMTGVAPFAWIRGSESGGSSDFQLGPDGQGKALRTSFDGFGDRIRLSQMVVFEPGSYRLDGRWWIETSDAQPFLWTVVCEKTGAELARVPVKGTTEHWQNFQLAFAIGPECGGVRLMLVAEEQDHRSSSVSWFNSFKIQPVS